MGCTGKLRLFLIDAPPGPKVSYFKDKVRLPAEVLGTAKPPFLWNLVLYPAKRGAVKQILTFSINSVRIQPLRAPRIRRNPLVFNPLCKFASFVVHKIRKLHLRSFLDHLLLAAASSSPSLVPLPRPERSSFLLNWHRPSVSPLFQEAL